MGKNFLRQFFRRKIAAAALILLVLELLAVILLPPLLHLDPYTTDPLAMNRAPDAAHLLGPTRWAATCWPGWSAAGATRSLSASPPRWSAC